MVEAFVWNDLTTNGEIVWSAGVTFQAGTRHKVVIRFADGIGATKVSGTTVDAGFHAVLI